MKLSKKEKKEIVLVISSFLLGGLVMCLFLTFLPTKSPSEKITIYEKKSLSKSINKVADTALVVESYTGSSLDSTGSGFYYKKDMNYAYILTNEHILSGTSIMVTNSDDQKFDAEVLGKDQYLDLAVLRVKKKYCNKIVDIGSSDKTNIGDTIFTIGAPLGTNYKGSVTSGIISGKDRMVQTSVGENKSGNWLMKVIQFDAAINKGNSGGPLFNINGDVIGICSLKLIDEGIEGMGFAIPIEYAMDHIKELENKEELKWPELGIKMVDLTSTGTIMNNDIDIPENIRDGVVIIKVKENSCAEKAKLQKGDIITSIEDNSTRNIAYLKYELFQHKVGDTIKVKYIRNGKEKTTEIKLDSSK